ncbi:reverse transcriptase family protein [Arthrobacter sp. UNC362MFTsu5.1]|uniref:reverse transcriptase family protein n=1 Tax=Arthrobacter sp. UNC362MFTsu5.1 TaxID=1449044 RepID=UPI002F360EAA
MMSRRENLRRTGAPVVYSLKHLATTTGVDYGYLRGVIRNNAHAYRAMRIPKNTGGFRDLLSPHESLMHVQRWILHEILVHVQRHVNNFAYFRKVTARECAERHAGAAWMIKADIHNYFPTISEKDVYRVFLSLGYSSLLSFELARLCTWRGPAQVDGTYEPKEQQGNSLTTPYRRVGLGHLPQGSPTSGALANACTLGLDDALSDFAASNYLIYTRYSDDMTFSSPGSLDRERARQFIKEIRKIVTASGLALHAQKTKIIPPGSRKIVLGMLISDDGVGILPEHRRMVDLYIHAVSKYGPVDYSVKRRFDSVLSFINHVEGWLAYLSHIDRPWTKLRSEAWNAALLKHGVLTRTLG